MIRSVSSLLRLSPLAAAVAALVLVPTFAARAAWEAVPEVTLGADSNTNTRLDETDDSGNTSRTFLDARIGLANVTQRSSLTFAPRFVTDAYADSQDSDLQADEFYLSGTGRRDWQSVGLGFRTSYANQSVLTAELAEAIPENPDEEPEVDADTGRLVIFNEKREQLVLRGDVDIRISPRNAFNIQTQRRSVDYSGSAQTALQSRRTDFDENRVSLGLTRRVDERNNVSAKLFVSDYTAALNNNETNSVGVEGRFERPVSQNWRFNLAAGVQRSDYDFLDLRTQLRVVNADTNYTLGAGLRRRGQTSSVNLDLTHSVNPSASGFLDVRDEIRGYYRRELTPRVGMQVGVRVARSNTLDDVVLSNERDFTRAEVGFEWAASRTLFLEAGYQFIRQDFTNEGREDSSSNTIFLGVTYRGMSRLQR